MKRRAWRSRAASVAPCARWKEVCELLTVLSNFTQCFEQCKSGCFPEDEEAVAVVLVLLPADPELGGEADGEVVHGGPRPSGGGPPPRPPGAPGIPGASSRRGLSRSNCA